VTVLPAWSRSVHHDGSEIYVSNPRPGLGERVRLRLRVGAAAPVRQVYLRTFPDGEQTFAPLSAGAAAPPARWWEGDLTLREPAAHYRFLLVAVDGAWWYCAAGLSAHEPLDATDFWLLADPSQPDWVAEAVFYQIFPDRFANGDPTNDPHPGSFEALAGRPQTYPWEAPPAPEQPRSLVFYGGDLAGILQRLDYLTHLGVNALYLNPVFTAYSNHRYDVVDHERVDPHLGGDAALVALREALDERGMRYILDVVPNHCGVLHPWFQAARQDLDAPEAAFFTFTHHPDDYASWLGARSLPKLNYRSEELRRRIYAGDDSLFRRWLRPPFSADGWRVDVANMLARQGPTQLGVEVARGIREAVKQTDPEAYLLGENFFDASPQLRGDQWDGVMNYAGFGFPLLHWLRGYRVRAWGQAEEIESPVPWPTAALAESWRQRLAAVPWASALAQYNLLGSHDTPRLRSLLGGRADLQRLAAVVQFTFPGVPGLYYGDEVGMEDRPGLGPRAPMIWDEARWDRATLALYRDLIALRRSAPALQRGGFQVLVEEEDTLAYQREAPGQHFVVVAHRGERLRPPGPLPVAHGGVPDRARFVERFSGQEASVAGGALDLPEQPQGAWLWERV
jgi:alpha-glucosidase